MTSACKSLFQGRAASRRALLGWTAHGPNNTQIGCHSFPLANMTGHPCRTPDRHWVEANDVENTSSGNIPNSVRHFSSTFAQPCKTLPQNPRGTLLNLSAEPPRSTPEPDHPGALAEPCRTSRKFAEPYLGPPRSLSGLRPQSIQLLANKMPTHTYYN